MTTRILFLTQVLPYPLTTGAKSRAYYMLRYLAQQHEVTLVSFVREDDRLEAIEHLRQFCAGVYKVPMVRSHVQNGLALIHSLLSHQPVVIIRDRLHTMEALLQRLVQDHPFDAIHADQTSMAQYALYARNAHPRKRRPRILLDQHNAMYLLVKRQASYEKGVQRLLWQREAALFRRYETNLMRQFDHILTVSDEDRDALLQLFPTRERSSLTGKMTALPICVDPKAQPPVDPVDEGPHILHLGTMFWPPNVEGVLWFAREVLPLLLQRVPDACFTIAGKNPPASVTSLAESGSSVAGQVRVTGFVPDPQPLLRQCRAFIVPVQAGGGMRVKIVDGWQWGVPIVSTTIGAEGIVVRPGENILIADEPKAFADAVIRLLTDPVLNEALRENGRKWVEAHYDWQQAYRQVDRIYAELCKDGGKPYSNHLSLQEI